jgi:hypothetical protein
MSQTTGIRKLVPAHEGSNAIPYDQVSAAFDFGGQLHRLKDFFRGKAGRRGLFVVVLEARDTVRCGGGPQADQERGLFVHGSSPPYLILSPIRRRRSLKGYNPGIVPRRSLMRKLFNDWNMLSTA